VSTDTFAQPGVWDAATELMMGGFVYVVAILAPRHYIFAGVVKAGAVIGVKAPHLGERPRS